jgi:topoisomerase-4 subunit B
MSHSDDLFQSARLHAGAPLASPAPGPSGKKSGKAGATRAVQSKNALTDRIEKDYSASSIEVLEGLEPVRRRPGMYIGGTDERALHHLFAEVIDNAMDEAVAGHAGRIEIELFEDGSLQVSDNGRGIPVDPHPKMPDKSALEVIMTTLHAGGKFDSGAYETSGGLHGVGISVVNALSDGLLVEVARERKLYCQRYSRGKPLGPLEMTGEVMNRRGTVIRFHPDPDIFGAQARFNPALLFQMARSKAYLFAGVEIRWKCNPALLGKDSKTPAEAIFQFPGGLKDYVQEQVPEKARLVSDIFAGKVLNHGKHGAVEWALVWHLGDNKIASYCNTVPTGDGGTHETGLRMALLRGLKNYGEISGNKKAGLITSEDVLSGLYAMLSVFIREPEFVGQTKDKLATAEASRVVENALRDAFDHWLAGSPGQANRLLDWAVDRAEERLRRRQQKEINRKTATRKLRLPGKLADCANDAAEGSELFIVEGDSAGGSAKQARNRHNQAVLPLRGKILNVASASQDKIVQNQQLADLVQALGCGTGSRYREEDLRYERIIIMTDADVDGAHIASLLMTFFHNQMPDLIYKGHLFLAVPPLYRLTAGNKTVYARDDAHKDELLATHFKGRNKVDIGRFKGLGEMMPKQLKDTTMDPKTRSLLQVRIDNREAIKALIDQLMGTKAESRFQFIQDRAEFVEDLDV